MVGVPERNDLLKKTMKDKFHNVYKYYNHHFLLVFTNKILSD